MEKKKQKIFFTYYNLLIGKDLWQAHHQILLTIFLIEFITLNTNTKIMAIKCETCGNKHKYCGCFLEYTKMIKQNTNNCVARKIINISSMKNKRNDFLLHTHFLTRIIISLFYCCKKVFYL